jgi:hypothetical protein
MIPIYFNLYLIEKLFGETKLAGGTDTRNRYFEPAELLDIEKLLHIKFPHLNL